MIPLMPTYPCHKIRVKKALEKLQAGLTRCDEQCIHSAMRQVQSAHVHPPCGNGCTVRAPRGGRTIGPYADPLPLSSQFQGG